MLAQPRTIRAAIERTERYISAGCPGMHGSRSGTTKEEAAAFERSLLGKMVRALDKAERAQEINPCAD